MPTIAIDILFLLKHAKAWPKMRSEAELIGSSALYVVSQGFVFREIRIK
jgi:hypothetical protein